MARQLTTALLCLGAIAMGAAQYLGSPWPGVALAGLSLLPWGWAEWLGKRANAGLTDRLWRLVDETTAISEKVVYLERRATEHHEQINSLRSTVSLRGTLGG